MNDFPWSSSSNFHSWFVLHKLHVTGVFLCLACPVEIVELFLKYICTLQISPLIFVYIHLLCLGILGLFHDLLWAFLVYCTICVLFILMRPVSWLSLSNSMCVLLFMYVCCCSCMCVAVHVCVLLFMYVCRKSPRMLDTLHLLYMITSSTQCPLWSLVCEPSCFNCPISF